ncbi:hypothetical protein K7H91_12220 [Martelella mediterranea]|uniref:hypothetical protein n=1 Tax=Martelella mediterranea TaxID=293089 RepID=UPI001E2B09DB|nr:hypothetical protein [Martelella mediterranea]MCD1634538.1 hypothetical protein [Martelella mediterranea]
MLDNQPETYVPAHLYFEAIDRLKKIARNYEPDAHDDLQSMIIEAVSETLNVWPDTVREEGISLAA